MRDGGHIGGIARKHPRAHRQPIAREGQSDHDLGVAVTALFVAPTLAPRGNYATLPQLTLFILFINLTVEGGGIPEDQVHIRVEQLGGPKEDLLLEGFDMAQQEIHDTIEVLQRQGVRFGPIDVVGQPLLIAGHLGPRTSQSVGGHGQQSQVVGGLAAGLLHLGAQERADA